MEFLEVLTEDIDRVLMVRGSGSEVITIYSWRNERSHDTNGVVIQISVVLFLKKRMTQRCVSDSVMIIAL